MDNPQVLIQDDGTVRLTLPGKEYKEHRTLGQIKDGDFHCWRRNNHVFRVFGGSIGFNYELMRDFDFNKVIVHRPGGKTLKTTRLHVLSAGRFLHFKKNDLERQIILPLVEFGLDKARESVKVEKPKSNLQQAREMQHFLLPQDESADVRTLRG